MKFEKGKPRHPNAGRKKGSPNIKKIPKVAEYLAEQDINPAAEILRILATDKLLAAKDQKISARGEIAIWMDLLSYCQGKPKDEAPDDQDVNDVEMLDAFKDVSSQTLLKLVKQAEEEK